MENTVSNKLRLLLNELAILNQPELIEGKFIYNAQTLQRIKQLSSELYLLADLGQGAHFSVPETQLESHSAVEDEMPEVLVSVEPPANAEEVETVAAIEVVEDVPVPAVEIAEEIAVVEQVTPPTPIVEETPTAEALPFVNNEPEPQVLVEEETSIRSTLKKREIQISLTRRFEYINNLYSGDANEFGMFIHALETSLNLSEALGIYEREYDARNWQKRAESADDLKQIIKRSF